MPGFENSLLTGRNREITKSLIRIKSTFNRINCLLALHQEIILSSIVELQAPVGATLAPGTALDATAKGAAGEARAVTAAEVEARLN